MANRMESITSEASETRIFELDEFLRSLNLPEGRLDGRYLEALTNALALRPDLFRDLVSDNVDSHWSMLLYRAPGFEVKVLAWQGEQPIDWHDHGGSSGAMAVVAGSLLEQYRTSDDGAIESKIRDAGDYGAFGPEHVHDVNFVSGQPAISLHAYSPPLSAMTHYDHTRFGFVARDFTIEETPSGARHVHGDLLQRA
jgi:Cysteine dioxygenase type I